MATIENKKIISIMKEFADNYNIDDEKLLELLKSMDSVKQNDLVEKIGKLNIGNCGDDTYQIARRIEKTIYKIRYGVFANLILPGKYLEDHRIYLNMLAISKGKPCPFPRIEAG